MPVLSIEKRPLRRAALPFLLSLALAVPAGAAEVIVNGPAGANGTNGVAPGGNATGGRKPAATIADATDSAQNVNLATANAGAGGVGGNGGAGSASVNGGRAGPGGFGGDAQATARSTPATGTSRAQAIANGGRGGNAGMPGVAGPGTSAGAGSVAGNGGDAHSSATAVSSGNAQADSTSVGGNGGDAFGTNGFGGNGGGATARSRATSIDGDATVSATLRGGNGGSGFNGAEAGHGASVRANYDTIDGSARNNLSVTKMAVGGNGGNSQTRYGGHGGDAYVEGSHSSSQGSVTVQAVAIGGNGGASNTGNGGRAGSAYLSAGAWAVAPGGSANVSGRAVGGLAGAGPTGDAIHGDAIANTFAAARQGTANSLAESETTRDRTFVLIRSEANAQASSDVRAIATGRASGIRSSAVAGAESLSAGANLSARAESSGTIESSAYSATRAPVGAMQQGSALATGESVITATSRTRMGDRALVVDSSATDFGDGTRTASAASGTGTLPGAEGGTSAHASSVLMPDEAERARLLAGAPASAAAFGEFPMLMAGSQQFEGDGVGAARAETTQLLSFATTEDAPLMMALLGLTQPVAGNFSVYIEVRLDGNVLLSETIAAGDAAGFFTDQAMALAMVDGGSTHDLLVFTRYSGGADSAFGYGFAVGLAGELLAVPEPQSYALFLAGLLVLALRLRYRAKMSLNLR